MKKQKNKNIGFAIAACVCLALFLVLTALVLFVDVAAAGDSGARVGLSHINEAVFNDLGKNGAFKKITDVCAGVGVLTIAFFVGLFIFQWVKRKSLKKVDLDLYFALGAGVLALVLYVFFELVVVNCRPILIDGGFEKSYPSSHTMFVTIFVGVGIVEAFLRLKKEWAKWLVFAAGVCVILLGGIGRLFAGVHWFTDVVAGYLLSGAVVFAFAYIAFRFKGVKNNNGFENGKRGIILRTEEPADFDTVENLTREAFWNVYREGCFEHLVVSNMRKLNNFNKNLSIVLQENGEIVGAICGIETEIKMDDNTTKQILEMGPISVRPDKQKQGFGKMLILEFCLRAKNEGYGAIAITGNPNYYSRFGFKPAKEFNIKYADLPDDADSSFFMIKELKDNYFDKKSGVFNDNPVYLVTQQEVDEFDKKFPPKLKEKTNTQIF